MRATVNDEVETLTPISIGLVSLTSIFKGIVIGGISNAIGSGFISKFELSVSDPIIKS